ncbi:transcription initiation factor TFIID subunit 11 family protein [Aspergillus affinis]|uniref:transcription initiation factor TFIID subunit 11 family protein n=1 Tax=Aspergillus affinis TaxID=1070780 RepID=UPI0022FDC1E4|nr:histone-fold-containing protein [Aspergillus affinis]KAI9037020.1 histone-fold-containing protein [Aspergillus affinis]
MSSPPPPPSNPLKRPSISSSASQPLGGGSSKRARMHPLRQTSFPTTIDADSRAFASAASDAGSVTGSFTGSLGGASADGVFSGTKAKKRGRKSKAEKEREQREDAMSARGGAETRSRFGSVDADGQSVRGGQGTAGGGGGGVGGGEDADDDEDFDDEGELLGREEGATDTEAEKKNLALLVDAFNPLQSERYDLFKRAKLRKETLRRIVNHALSQSVPASVVTTINGFTKVFAGEIIEKARTVQAEWANAHDQTALAAYEAEEEAADAAAGGGGGTPGTLGPRVVKPQSDPPTTMTKKPEESEDRAQGPSATTRPRREFKLPPNPHRGQLLPTHLREALRRYKRDGEGGGVGFSGLSMGNLGVRGSVTWSAGSVGGRRIFR